MKSKQEEAKVLVLGNFGYANHDLSGQTIKTRVSRELLETYYSPDNVDYFDTQTLNQKKNIFKLLRKVCSCDILFYLPAHGNLKYLFPIYFILSKLFSFEIVYSVIGGWLVPYLKNKPMHRCMLKRIKVILAETIRMKKELEKEYDFKNVDVLYNFRLIDYKPILKDHDDLRLVFMARIDPKKGLDTIFKFCKYISTLNPRPNITVSFYGPFSPFITESEFMAEVNEFDFVKYYGPLEPGKINKAIAEYDVMLLPTHYYTEGLPGTIIDSYTSGLPVIVSNWRHAKEFVEDGKSGLIIPFNNHQDAFNRTVMSLYNDRNLLNNLKLGACIAGKTFTGEGAWIKVKPYLTK